MYERAAHIPQTAWHTQIYTPIARIKAYPTQFDQNSAMWKNMSNDITDYCTVEVVLPDTIKFIVGTATVETLTLDSTFKCERETALSHVLQVSSAIYGFQFMNESNADQFSNALSGLKSHLMTGSMQYGRHQSLRAAEPPPFRQGPVENPQIPTNAYTDAYQPTHINPNLESTYQQTPMNTTLNNSYQQRSTGQRNGFAADTHQFNNSESEEQKEARDLCDRLSESIKDGNVEGIVEIAKELARFKAQVNIVPLTFSKTIDLTIKVEDKESAGGASMKISVDPFNTTIKGLKNLVHQKYHFPWSSQMYIINDRLAEDSDTLSKCRVTTSESVIYLYVKSNDETEKTNAVHQEKGYGLRINEPQENSGRHQTHIAPEVIQSQAPSNEQRLFGDTKPVHRNNTFGGRAPSNEQRLYGDTKPVHRYNTYGGRPRPNQMFVEDIELYGDNNMYGDGASAYPPMRPPETQNKEGWICPACTFKNLPTFPGCQVCMGARPEDYKIPPNYKLLPEERERMAKEEENERLVLQAEFITRPAEEAQQALQNYERLREAYEEKLLPNPEEFECDICYALVEVGAGAMLRECLHCFCRDCLIETIKASEDPEIHCPYNGDFACPAVITMQEIEELLPPEDFNKLLEKGLAIAERGTADSFHCRTPNCKGFCFFEDDVNVFDCEVCGKRNCITCKAIHPDITCKEYQDNLRIAAQNDEAAKKTLNMLEGMIAKGEAMNCPKCKIILQKKSGCDWMKCTMCRTEICWATRGPRWGPGGTGDTSGGCKCSRERRCTRTCGNCH